MPDALTLKRPPEDWLVVNTLGTWSDGKLLTNVGE